MRLKRAAFSDLSNSPSRGSPTKKKARFDSPDSQDENQLDHFPFTNPKFLTGFEDPLTATGCTLDAYSFPPMLPQGLDLSNLSMGSSLFLSDSSLLPVSNHAPHEDHDFTNSIFAKERVGITHHHPGKRELSKEVHASISFPSPLPDLLPIATLQDQRDASIREWIRIDSTNSLKPESPSARATGSSINVSSTSRISRNSKPPPTAASVTTAAIARRESLRRKSKKIRVKEVSTSQLDHDSVSPITIEGGNLMSPRSVVKSSIATLQALLEKDGLIRVRRTDYSLKRIQGATKALEAAVAEKEQRIGYCRNSDLHVRTNKKC